MNEHISARMNWHDNGCDGCICTRPKSNTYCIGPHSFQENVITSKRDVEFEHEHAGTDIQGLNYIPPCSATINAFGSSIIRAYSPTPSWLSDGTEVRCQNPPSKNNSRKRFQFSRYC